MMDTVTFRSAVRGDTKLVCLLGNPVAHSISPVIHNHAFASLNLPYCYVPLAVEPRSVHVALQLLRAARFAGANVTIPHKSSVIHYCDRLSPLSKVTGTVNTLYWDGDLLCGTTTDCEGFCQALRDAGHELAGSSIVILGNGGAARTLSIALGLEGKIASLCIVGRNRERISALARAVKERGGFETGFATLDDPRLGEIMENCTLLVNCTNVGMHPKSDATPLDARFFHEGMMVFDAIYNPAQTRFLLEASQAGCRTENGLRMLLFQGLASLRYWTGITVSPELFPVDKLQALVERG